MSEGGEMTIGGLVAAAVRTWPDKTALCVQREGAYRAWSYREMVASALTLARRLQELGIASDDRVALYAENSPEWVLAFLGIHFAGAVAVPLDALYAPLEVAKLLRFSRCRALIGSRQTLENAGSALADSLPWAPIRLDAPGAFEGPPLDAPISREPADVMVILYTSGTTDDPKGVSLTVANLAFEVEAVFRLGFFGPSDTALCLLPLHHAYALTTTVVMPLAHGASVTFCTSLRGPDILQAMTDTSVTVLPGVPRLFEGFDRALAARLEKLPPSRRRFFGVLTRLSSGIRSVTGLNAARVLLRPIHRPFGPRFRFFISGGARLDPAIMTRFRSLGFSVIEGYGLTETSPVATLNPINRPKPGSVGVPLPGVKVRIAEPDGNGVGEVAIRGPNVMKGYDQKPDQTAAVIRDGWFYTGDLGCLDADGYLHITGRAKEVIVLTTGKNIHPDEVERHYEQSPLVREMCVMPAGGADGRAEGLCAVVVPDFDEIRRQKIHNAQDAIRADFLSRSQTLRSFMRITRIKLVTNELPRTRLGKLRRAVIQRMAFDEVKVIRPASLTPEDEALLLLPGADALVGRLGSLATREGEIVPGDHLALDLGLDSLARVELDALLRAEFGLQITPDEIPEVNTVRDLLVRLKEKGRRSGAVQPWGELLRIRPSPPMTKLFNLERGRVRRASLHAVRHVVRRLVLGAMPLDIQGLDALPEREPYLLCPNHASFLDPVIIYAGLPDAHIERMAFLGAEQFFRSWLMRWLARAGRVIPTASSDVVLLSLQRAAEAVSLGLSVCVFPEGFITRDGLLQEPRLGAGILACELGVPVVPVLLRGTYDVVSYTHRRFRLCPVGMTLGRPIRAPNEAAGSAEGYRRIMEAWRRDIVRMRRQDDASGSRTAGRSPRIPDAWVVHD